MKSLLPFALSLSFACAASADPMSSPESSGPAKQILFGAPGQKTKTWDEMKEEIDSRSRYKTWSVLGVGLMGGLHAILRIRQAAKEKAKQKAREQAQSAGENPVVIPSPAAPEAAAAPEAKSPRTFDY